jgi:hypothetical protein
METENGTVASKHFVESVAYLLRETIEGTPEGQPRAYLYRGFGIIATIKNLTADVASADFHGTTIAAQTEHAKFYLDRLCEFINGRTATVNWDDSWLIETVDDEEWNALQSTVSKSYENALRCIADVTDWNAQRMGMALGLVAHTAYHLGAIRQIAKAGSKELLATDHHGSGQNRER